MSKRECEGWVGMTYQAESGAARSTAILHVRMTDPTAQLQGEAIGVLGTNLVYLCNKTNEPYIIVSFLLDGLEDGRLEVDYVDFSGPAFPEGSVDPRLLAMRMVQFRVANGVLLEQEAGTGRYQQAVPNNAFYKTPLVVQQSRFRPATYMHREVLDAAGRFLVEDIKDDVSRPVKKVLTMQIDDIVRPPDLVTTEGRLNRLRKMLDCDTNSYGSISFDGFLALFGGRYTENDLKSLFHELDITDSGRIKIDDLLGYSRTSILATEFLDRFNMLEPMRFSVLVSGMSKTTELASYLARYTNAPIAVAIGGGTYSLEKSIFDKSRYDEEAGGMLEALGKLFSGNVRILEYPNVLADGSLTNLEGSAGAEKPLHDYLVQQGDIVLIPHNFITPDALCRDSNTKYRGQSFDVMELIHAGSSEWEQYVPPEVVEIVKKRVWFKRLSSSRGLGTVAYKVLSML